MEANKYFRPSKSRQIAEEVSVLEFYNWNHTKPLKKHWKARNEREVKGVVTLQPKRNELVNSLMHLRISFEEVRKKKRARVSNDFPDSVTACWMFTISPQNPLRRADGRKFSCTWLQRIRLISSKKHLGQVHPLGDFYISANFLNDFHKNPNSTKMRFSWFGK